MSAASEWLTLLLLITSGGNIGLMVKISRDLGYITATQAAHERRIGKLENRGEI